MEKPGIENLKPYRKGEQRARDNGAKGGRNGRGPQFKNLIKKLLTQKIELTDVEREKLSRFLGYEVSDDEITQEFIIVSKMIERARKNDSTFEKLLDLSDLHKTASDIEIHNHVDVSDPVAAAIERLKNS